MNGNDRMLLLEFIQSFQTDFKNTLSKQKYVWERAFGSIRLKPGNYFFRKYFLKEPNDWNFQPSRKITKHYKSGI